MLSEINPFAQVDIACQWVLPNGQQCGQQFQFMSDVVHHVTMDHVGGPGEIYNSKAFFQICS